MIIIGGAYERLILSDYGIKKEHGRSYMFWTGMALQEASFRKEMTSMGKFLRSHRNLICQASLFTVIAVEPLSSFISNRELANLIIAMTVKIFILNVPIVYTFCLMHEDTYRTTSQQSVIQNQDQS